MDERAPLRALLGTYLAELSRYGPVDQHYPWFEAYWQAGEPRWPYVIEDNDGTALGFALVNTHPPAGLAADYAMAEFYVVPSARSRGIGRAAAVATFRRHPGAWALSVLGDNLIARQFWTTAIAAAGAANLDRLTSSEGVAYRFLVTDT